LASTVTEELMNTVLKNVLKLILGNVGTLDAPWMNRIASKWTFIIVVVSDLQQVGVFFRVLWFPQPIKLTAMI
jgi:hypothetical protein